MFWSVPVLALFAAGLPAADEKPDRKDDGLNGVVVKMDAKDHAVTIRLKDADGKEVEKTFAVGDGLQVTDESGKASSLDAVQPGDVVVAVERGGRLAELRRASREQRRVFDVDRFLERHDKNKDGFIQRDELPERLQHAFDELDTNKDGKLSREELERGAALLQRQRRPADVIDVLVENADCDEDCAKELQFMYDRLRKLDRNNSGKIDPAALKETRDRLVAARVDEILKDLDANGDGKISRDEARGWVKQDFDKIDTNKDGFIDRDELLKAASERPAVGEKDPGPAPTKPLDK